MTHLPLNMHVSLGCLLQSHLRKQRTSQLHQELATQSQQQKHLPLRVLHTHTYPSNMRYLRCQQSLLKHSSKNLTIRISNKIPGSSNSATPTHTYKSMPAAQSRSCVELAPKGCCLLAWLLAIHVVVSTQDAGDRS